MNFFYSFDWNLLIVSPHVSHLKLPELNCQMDFCTREWDFRRALLVAKQAHYIKLEHRQMLLDAKYGHRNIRFESFLFTYAITAYHIHYLASFCLFSSTFSTCDNDIVKLSFWNSCGCFRQKNKNEGVGIQSL